MDDRELEFHARHIMLDDLGIEAVERLKAATVLVVGLGGLGCPAATQLAGCGTGRLVLADDDLVERANLQRQGLYRAGDVGEPKVAVAARVLAGINEMVTCEPQQVRVDPDNLPGLVSQADVIVDGSDNFATRHAVNAACLASGKPLVTGAAEGFDGQVATFDFATSRAPCYACLFPADAGEPAATPCAVLGVFAPLTAMVGALMAAEAVRHLALPGHDGLRSRLLAWDMRGQRTRTVSITPAPGCPACGGG